MISSNILADSTNWYRVDDPFGVPSFHSYRETTEENLMRRIAKFLAGAALVTSTLGAAPIADAAQTTHDTTVYPQSPEPAIQPLDCVGTTGSHGCGPGWDWRDGWRGFSCYPC